MSKVTKKIWAMSAPNFSKSDELLLKGLNCQYKIYRDDPKTFEVQGKMYQFAGTDPRLTVITTNDQQEDMIRLKYGDKLVLMQVYHEKFTSSLTYVPQ